MTDLTKISKEEIEIENDTSRHKWELYINKMNNHTRKIQNLFFNQVRATALILLNYKCGPTRRIGVKTAIIDHIRHSPVMGIFLKQK